MVLLKYNLKNMRSVCRWCSIQQMEKIVKFGVCWENGVMFLKEGQMNIEYDTFVDAKLGEFYFALLDDAIIWLFFGPGYSTAALEKDLVAYLKEPITLTHVSHPEKVAQFQAYLRGELKEFPMAYKVLHSTDFQNAVYEACAAVGYGETKTYGELAKILDNPKGSRAVGQALRRNPIPLLIPCHRIIGSNFSMRGYGGKEGVGTKAYLLALEGAMFSRTPEEDAQAKLF